MSRQNSIASSWKASVSEHGLGLSIAATAVRRHGGRIGAQNADDGGLIVRISLPYITDNKQV